MAGQQYEIKFTADGSEVTTTVNNINKATKILNQEIKKAFDPSSLDKMNSVLDLQKQKLQSLQQALDGAKEKLAGLEVGSDAWIAQNQQVANLEAQISRLNGQIDKTTATIGKLSATQAPSFAQSLNSQLQSAKPLTDALAGGFDNVVKAALKLGTGAVAAAVGGVGALLAGGVKEAVSAYDNMNSLQATFDFAGRTKKQFNSAKKFIMDYAAQTEFSAADITQAYNQMGLDGSKASNDLIKGLGGLTQAFSDPALAMKQMLPQLAQIQTAGKLTNEDFKVMKQYMGKDIVDALQKSMEKAGAFSGDFATAMQNGEISSDEFNAAVTEVGNNPALQKQAESASSISGAFGVAIGSVQEAIQPLVDQIMPVLTSSIQQAGDAIGGFITQILQMPADQLQAIGGAILGVATAIGAILTAGKIASVVTNITELAAAGSSIMGAFGPIGGILSAAFSPVGAIIAAIGLLVGAFVYFYTTSETFRDIVNGAVSAVLNGIIGFVNGVISWFNSLNIDWQATWNNFQVILATAWNIISGIFNNFTPYFSAIWNTVSGVFSGAFTMIGGYFQVFASVVTGIINIIGNLLAGNFSGAWQAAKNMVAGVITGMGNVLRGLGGVITSAIGGAVSAALALGKGIIDSIIDGMGDIGGAIWNAIVAGLSALGNIKDKVVNWVTGGGGGKKGKHTANFGMPNIATQSANAVQAFRSGSHAVSNNYGGINLTFNSAPNNNQDMREIAQAVVAEIARTTVYS